ncbi:putative phosphoglycolate phosphatase, bacterial [Selenomonas sp. oral taxon 137 str. F0430]|uniref:HAD family hydrolase n=1 Tax=Selenomonas sp. oral taxon 137 TaxID=712531 RepID=UPI0001EB2A59|nr:HAD family hydrolase [Selenomonas sp. oral taxon 137]EFR40193.1 putative phosphoglycolate phosphatase, bacterial [Selenomonas sp. oral taxon 137 str. F0430]
MHCQAAVFDLDGTLVDSLADLADAANAMLASYRFRTHDVGAYRYFVGDGSRKLIERILPKERSRDAAFVDEAMARYKDCYAERLLHQTKPYDGIPEMLEELRRRNIPMAICTNKHQSAADAIVEALFPKNMFQEVIGDRRGLPRKPDPQKVLHIARRMGVSPASTAYFGDTAVDMDTAHNAGTLAVGVLWGFRPQQELTEHGAQILLSHPRELFQKLTFCAQDIV